MIVDFEDVNGEVVYGDEYPDNMTLLDIVEEAKNIDFDATRPIKFISICVK